MSARTDPVAERGAVPDLRLDGVTLRAGPVRVLEDVTLAVSLEGITLLSGRNGAGKTTLLNALLGTRPVQGGTLLIGGMTPRAVRRRVGYMPQMVDEAAMMLPVASHVAAAVGGGAWGMAFDPRARMRETRRALALVGAEGFARRPLEALSGGERQRVCLARALVDRPDLLLLDEPLAGLDHRAQRDIVALLRDLTRGTGPAVLMTSHENAPLNGAVSRVVELGEGRLDVRV